MDFRLDDDQTELQATVARFCASRFPLEHIADLEHRAVDRTRWRELAELGLLGVLLDEAAGGSGLGALDAALCFEQLGSALIPGPVLWTVLSAGLLEGAGDGERVVAGTIASGDVGRSGVIVEHGADADALLVVGDDVVTAHACGDLTPERLDPLDPLTPVVRFRRLPAGEQVGGRADAERIRLTGTVLSAALLLGVAGRSLEVARAYALERHQFGAPIGSFQAIKHLLADMYVRTSLAESATYAAAAVVEDAGRTDPWRAAATAKLLAADAAQANAGAAVQVLGGMGFTWAMLPHYLVKRAWVLDQAFGTAEELAGALGPGGAAA